MAADLSVNDAAVVIQAQTRGFLARRKLLEVRKEFQEVLKELEGDAKFVCWKEEGLGVPLVTFDPEVLNGANERSNIVSRGNDNKSTRKQGLLKERLGSDTDVGGEIFPKVQSGNKINSDTEEHSPRNETLNELHTDQVEKQISIDHEGAILERTSSSLRSRCDGDFLQKKEFLPVNEMETSHIVDRNDESTRPAEKSLGRLENSGRNAQEKEFDCAYDKRTVYSSDFPPSGTINPILSNEQEIKETTEHNNRSEASQHDFVQRRPYLRDQALLSESWMSDRSFDPVEDDKTTAFTALPTEPIKLRELRNHIGMELLWTEQAIQSRRKYLGFRQDLSHKEPCSDSTISLDRTSSL